MATTTKNTNTNTSPLHAAILCPPGIGHMIPIFEIAKLLVTHKIIPKLTIFYVSIKNCGNGSKAETQVLQSAKESNLFEIIQLPPIDITPKLAPDANLGHKLVLMMNEMRPLLSHAISTLPPQQKPTIFITDLLGCSSLPVAEAHKMSKYVILPNAIMAALSLHTPTLDKEVKGAYLDQAKPIKIPGITNPLNPSDLFTPMLDRTHPQYYEYVRDCENLRKVDGILLRTFNELEPNTLKALRGGEVPKVPPVYPVGGVIRETKQNCDEKRSDVLDWLDKQEEESVIYISFGSGYTMSYEQIREMALGLELSEKRFVWSVRPPASRAGIDHYLTAGEDAARTNGVSKLERSSDFPDEFYRIQNMGLIVTDWAPQLEILRHPSVGGFVSHCGWNSVTESVSCGVPIVGWPLFAEQKMNAAMLAEEARIAIRVKASLSTNVVERDEIARAIRKIMDKEDNDGLAIRKRIKELKGVAANAWSRDGPAILELASAFRKTNH